MYHIRKIYWRRALRKLYNIALRRKRIYLVGKNVQIQFNGIQIFLVIGHVFLPFQNLPEPCQLGFFLFHGFIARFAFLILPVRRNTIFACPVHFPCPDLYFERFAGRPNQRIMQGLVHIRFRHCNIILEPPRHGLIHRMNNTQHAVAVPDGIHNCAHRKQIVNLVKRFVLVDHFLVNTEKMLAPPLDFALDSGLVHFRLNVLHNVVDKRLPFNPLFFNFRFQIKIRIGIEVLKAEVLHLRPYFGYTEPVCQRRIDIQRFLRFFLLLRRRHKVQRPHVMQAVSQLDQYDADILCHRKEHFPVILRLYFLFCRIGKFAQLCYAIHQYGNFLAEQAGNILIAVHGVLDNVVQYARNDGFSVQFQFRQNIGYLQWMDDIWLP